MRDSEARQRRLQLLMVSWRWRAMQEEWRRRHWERKLWAPNSLGGAAGRQAVRR